MTLEVPIRISKADLGLLWVAGARGKRNAAPMFVGGIRYEAGALKFLTICSTYQIEDKLYVGVCLLDDSPDDEAERADLALLERLLSAWQPAEAATSEAALEPAEIDTEVISDDELDDVPAPTEE